MIRSSIGHRTNAIKPEYNLGVLYFNNVLKTNLSFKINCSGYLNQQQLPRLNVYLRNVEIRSNSQRKHSFTIKKNRYQKK